MTLPRLLASTVLWGCLCGAASAADRSAEGIGSCDFYALL